MWCDQIWLEAKSKMIKIDSFTIKSACIQILSQDNLRKMYLHKSQPDWEDDGQQ